MLAANIERIVIRLAIILVVLAAVAGIFSLTPNGQSFVERLAGNSSCEPNCTPAIDQAEAALRKLGALREPEADKPRSKRRS